MKKADALAKHGVIYTSGSFGNYEVCKNYDELVCRIKRGKKLRQMICEYIHPNRTTIMYFDLDGEEDDPTVLEKLKGAILKLFDEEFIEVRFIVLTSHKPPNKYSYHLFVRFFHKKEHKEWAFKNVEELKTFLNFHKLLTLGSQKMKIDPVVYRDGLFRTVFSDKVSKDGTFSSERRPFIFDESQSYTTDIKYTLIHYFDEEPITPFYELMFESSDCTSSESEAFDSVVLSNKKRVADRRQTHTKKRKLETQENLPVLNNPLHENITTTQYQKSLDNLIRSLLSDYGLKKKFRPKLSNDHYYMNLDGVCPFKKALHKNNYVFIVYKKDFQDIEDVKVWLKCHDEVCSQHFIIAQYDENNQPTYFQSEERKKKVYNVNKRYSLPGSDSSVKGCEYIFLIKFLMEKYNFFYDMQLFFINIDGIWNKHDPSEASGVLLNEIHETILNIAKGVEDWNEKEKTLLLEIKDIFQYGSQNFLRIFKGASIKKDLSKKLDCNKNIIAFQNGCYDFTLKKFRHIIPEDYVSNVIKRDYVPNTSKDLDTFLESILPDADTREYLFTIMGNALKGEFKEEILVFLIGIGANGKSVFLTLLEQALPGVIKTINDSIFSFVNQSQARPDIIKLKNTRIGLIKEVGNVSFNSDVIKKLTGQDIITSRRLYSSEEEFKISTLILLSGNNIPRLGNNVDAALLRRLRVIKFPTLFCENPTAVNEKKINTKIKTEHIFSTDWQNALVTKLIEHSDKDPVCPIKVREDIKSYLTSETSLNIFLESHIRLKEGEITSAKEIFCAFLKFDENPERILKDQREIIGRINTYIMNKFDTKRTIKYCKREKKSKRGYENIAIVLTDSFVTNIDSEEEFLTPEKSEKTEKSKIERFKSFFAGMTG